MADLKQFTLKDKPVKYTEAFIELYNQKNHDQIHKIYRMIELEKMFASTIKNFYNLNTYYIIKKILVLYNAHVVFRDPDKFVFCINNFNDWN